MKRNWKWIVLAFTLLVALGCDNEEPAAEADWIIAVTANPASIGSVNPTECNDTNDPSRCGYYGSSQLRAIVYNGNGTPQKGVGVRFATDQGRLESGGDVVKTNSRGEAEDILWTHDDATITVTSGSVEATVDVAVGNENEAPIAIADMIPANEARIGRQVMFDAGESTDDVEIVRYVWNVQSDNPDPDKPNPMIREDEPPNDHFQETFDQAQTLRVMLTVYDGDGA
ncbi:MAG: hypothetical protein KBD01_17935, partial [Acidobacteria bacterium]|nr:hypothetical protein [Acidobacteriota bacterium]